MQRIYRASARGAGPDGPGEEEDGNRIYIKSIQNQEKLEKYAGNSPQKGPDFVKLPFDNYPENVYTFIGFPEPYYI